MPKAAQTTHTDQIQEGKVVNLRYQLKNSKGDVLDTADAESPFSYLHGASQIVPGLETALEGLKVGDKKSVTVSPEEGYGEVDPELKLVVNRKQFPPQLDIQPGMQFETGQGEGMVFQVEKVDGDQIHIDGNHPLAGETLHFDVEVLSVRDATEEEIEHGHAHDHDHDHDDHGGGHHH